MIKKINFLLVLLLLLVSIGAVSAADDLNDTIASDDGTVLEEVASEDVVASDMEDVVTSTSHVITTSNYGSYFNSKGEMVASNVNDGDTIQLSDDFSGKNFVFEKSLNVVGDGSHKLRNCMLTFKGAASGSVISNLNIFNTKDTTYGIFLNGVSNCVITNCFINNTGASSYAVCVANNANYNNITNNNLNAYGITYGHGTRSTPPVILSGAHYNYIAYNQISCDDANGIYLSSFSGGPLKGGNSNFNNIFNNTIKYNVLPTSWAYGIQLMGENNIVRQNKIIGAYMGIVGGIGSIILDNLIIDVTGADFNHPGIPVGGQGGITSSANSIIRNNRIINAKIISTGSGISASDNSVIEDNYVQVTTYGVGIQPQGSDITIKNNTVITNAGAGILNYKTQFFNLYVIDNNIASTSGVGVLVQRLSAKQMPGNITVTNNVINTSNHYAIDISEADASMYYNTRGNTIIGDSQIRTPEGEYDPSKYNYEFGGKTYNISPDNYGDYINANGGLISDIDDGDILNFSGEFSNKYITLNKAVKLTGTNPIFYNTTFEVRSNGVWIEKLTIKNNNSARINAWGILICQITAATVYNCTIEVCDPNAAYAIYILESSQVNITQNVLSSSGNYLTYTILANTITDSYIVNNIIFTNGTGQLYTFEPEHCIDGDNVCPDGNSVCPDGNSVCPDGNSVCPDGNSVCPDGNEVCPEGSSVCTSGNSAPGSHVLREVYRTYGILIVYSSDNVISGNKVKVTSKLNQTYSTYNSTNSIVGIDLYYNSHNNVFSNNEVQVWGNDNYIYGMGVLGYYTTMIAPEGQGAENNQFIENKIWVNGTYFVTGIIVGSSSENTTLIGNEINGECANVSYGITLEMSKESIIKDNSIKLASDIVYGIEIFGTESFISNYNEIINNDLKINAKQAYGLVVSISNYNTISSNKFLIVISDDEGFEFKNITSRNYDTIVGGIAGIYLRSYSSNNSISDNNITITKGYAIIIDDEAINNIISDNYLDSANGTANDAVNSTANNVVEDNYIYLVSGTFADIILKYCENATFKFITDNADLNGAEVKFIDDYGNVFGTAVISDGEAKFIYDFDGFKEFTPAMYQFSAKVYKENYKVTEFNNMVTIENGILTVLVDNVTGAVARNAKFTAVIKNILGNGVEGILVEFYVIDEGYPIYVGKSTSDKDGNAVLTAEIPKIYGEIPQILVSINNPENFESASAYGNLTAYWLTDTSMSVNSNVYATDVLAILKDKNGKVLANKVVSVVINGKTYNLKTDSSGSVFMPAVARGTYSVSLSFEGDNEYYGSKNTVKVTVIPVITGNKDYSVYYGNTVKYTVRIIGTDGKYVGAGKVVAIKVNGKTYKVKTDKNGYATQSLKLKAGKYAITSEYNGDKVSNKITFKPTLTAKNIAVKKGKKVKFTVKLVDKKGKILKNKKVTFKVKGKKYSAKTNKKGKATATIKNLKKPGKYKITSSYGGCSISNKITIKK
ncbi:right-handed parallel beta-helix repeat-containing protein [Methanobrevibacter sp.]|uniref:right-handed parallel beta-helix repeat-containing protein n=1 Tax=Methanobrevibacter sp. TaxID=66852 RepID=UPI003867E351